MIALVVITFPDLDDSVRAETPIVGMFSLRASSVFVIHFNRVFLNFVLFIIAAVL